MAQRRSGDSQRIGLHPHTGESHRSRHRFLRCCCQRDLRHCHQRAGGAQGGPACGFHLGQRSDEAVSRREREAHCKSRGGLPLEQWRDVANDPGQRGGLFQCDRGRRRGLQRDQPANRSHFGDSSRGHHCRRRSDEPLCWRECETHRQRGSELSLEQWRDHSIHQRCRDRFLLGHGNRCRRMRRSRAARSRQPRRRRHQRHQRHRRRRPQAPDCAAALRPPPTARRRGASRVPRAVLGAPCSGHCRAPRPSRQARRAGGGVTSGRRGRSCAGRRWPRRCGSSTSGRGGGGSRAPRSRRRRRPPSR